MLGAGTNAKTVEAMRNRMRTFDCRHRQACCCREAEDAMGHGHSAGRRRTPFFLSMLHLSNAANTRYSLASAATRLLQLGKCLAGDPSGDPRTKPDFSKKAKSLKTMVGDTGIEPVPPRV